MTALRIGLVDLDTSHPGSFTPILRSLGHEIVGVFDGGGVNPAGYAETFASKHGIANVFDSLEVMAGEVDLAILHSCNWDIHVERARPFIEAGKGVFIDKPLAGNVRDLQQIIEWGKQGARITGGSALRYCYEVREWAEKGIPPEEVIYAVVGCGNDEFNYGIHAYSMLHGLYGAGITSARYLGTTGQDQFELAWSDGRRGVVSVGKTTKALPFYAAITTQTQVDLVKAANGQLYQALLETVLPYFSGEAPAPMAIEKLAETELAAIAGKLSKEQGGASISLDAIPLDYTGFDGTEFETFYRNVKYKK